MKKIIIAFLVLLISLSAFSQGGNDPTKYVWYKYTYGNRLARYWADTVLQIPADTIWSKDGLAIKSGALYFGNGTKWLTAGSGSTDSAIFQTIYRSDTAKIAIRNEIAASTKYFTSGSGAILSGTGTSIDPYKYDFGGTLTQNTHLSGSDLYDLFLDSMNSVNIVDDIGNFSSYSSQTHIFSTLGGPSGGSRHQVGDLLEMFSSNTANDHISHLNMYPDSVEISFQSTGAKGGAMFRQNGLFRTKGLPNKATPGGTDSVDVVDINGYHYKLPTSAFSGGSVIIPPNGGGAFRIYSPQIPNFRSLRGTGCTLDTLTTGEINITVAGSAGNFIGRDSVLTITSGTSSTVTNGYNIVRFNPASVMATYNLTLPTTWHTSNKILIIFDADAIIDGNPVITSLTITQGSGQTLRQRIIPLSADAGETISYHLVGTHDQRTGE